jgi:hypothetical protein
VKEQEHRIAKTGQNVRPSALGGDEDVSLGKNFQFRLVVWRPRYRAVVLQYENIGELARKLKIRIGANLGTITHKPWRVFEFPRLAVDYVKSFPQTREDPFQNIECYEVERPLFPFN